MKDKNGTGDGSDPPSVFAPHVPHPDAAAHQAILEALAAVGLREVTVLWCDGKFTFARVPQDRLHDFGRAFEIALRTITPPEKTPRAPRKRASREPAK